MYSRLVEEAKEQGLKPEYVVSLGIDLDQRVDAIKKAEIAGFLTAQETQLQLEHKKTKAELKQEEIALKTTSQKAIAELREKLNILPVNKMNEQLKEMVADEVKPDSNYWPDPFNQTDEYKKALASDKKAVPVALKNWEMTLAQLVEKRRAILRGDAA